MSSTPHAPLPQDSPASLASTYQNLHAHPELAFQERRTAGIVAQWLRGCGYETTTGVGGAGVVGILHNGPGRSALLRADMDALPVTEDTGLAYASTQRQVDADGTDVPVMHACGHDMGGHAHAGLPRAPLCRQRGGRAQQGGHMHSPRRRSGAGRRR
jgi:metal-dependent amidase/aminoacylase/carboxypeptidase family protein